MAIAPRPLRGTTLFGWGDGLCEVNSDNPLAQGLAISGWADRIFLPDAVTEYVGLPSNEMVGAPVDAPRLLGTTRSAVSWPGGQYNVIDLPDQSVGRDEVTILVYGSINPGVLNGLVGIATASNSTGGIGVKTDSSGKFRAFYYYDSSSANVATFTGDTTDYSPHTYAVSFKRGELRVYKDGVLVGSHSSTAAIYYQAGQRRKLILGAFASGSLDGWIVNYAVHNRALTAPEIAAYHANPWQLWRRSSVQVLPSSAAVAFDAAPSAATVQSITSAGATPKCTITRTGSSPAGTLYYVIYPDGLSAPSAAQVIAGQDSTGSAATASGNEACRTTTGDQIFASPATGCAASTAYRIAFVASDGVTPSAVAVSAAAFTTLSAAISVTGASSTQSNAGTAGAIQQTHLIGATSSTQANAGTTGTVQQTHRVSGASSTQANTGTAGSISTETVAYVTGASSTQGNTGSAGAIQQTHMVGAASSTQSNTGTAGSIHVAGAVAVVGADSAQANIGSAGSIQQTHRVGGANSTCAAVGSAGSILQVHLIIAADSTQWATGSAGSIGDVVIADIALAAQRQRNTNTARRGRANLASTGRYNVN